MSFVMLYMNYFYIVLKLRTELNAESEGKEKTPKTFLLMSKSMENEKLWWKGVGFLYDVAVKRSSRCCKVSLSHLMRHFIQSWTAIKSSKCPPTLRGAPFHISGWFEMRQRITSFYHASVWTASLLCKTGGGSAEQTFDVNKNACFPPTADMCWCVTDESPRQLYCIIKTTRITW